jgi:hypothetical protein
VTPFTYRRPPFRMFLCVGFVLLAVAAVGVAQASGSCRAGCSGLPRAAGLHSLASVRQDRGRERGRRQRIGCAASRSKYPTRRADRPCPRQTRDCSRKRSMRPGARRACRKRSNERSRRSSPAEGNGSPPETPREGASSKSQLPSGATKGSGSATTGSPVGDSNAPEVVAPVLEPPLSEPNGPGAPFRFFASSSFWNETPPAAAPLDPSSGDVVGALETEIPSEAAAGKGPTINTTSWSVPIFTVAAGQATVRVTLDGASSSALQSAWDAVPLPSDAQPAAGTDKHLVVWQPSTDRLWEFYSLTHQGDGWHADWGGAIQNESANPGSYGPEAWPGATTTWGASASSLSIAGGLITLEDLERGQINHALAMALPDVRGGVYASPAERDDGTVRNASYLPEGAHLRLDPSLNLATLHLPRLTLMMAEAAQKYGIFIRDYASNVAFYAQDPAPTGTEPYAGSSGYFEGKSPSQLLALFPWAHLQLLKMQLQGSG